MKILTLAIPFVAIMLSGCAHHVGYQRSYVGYGSGYGVQSQYGYPGSYYSPAPAIRYERYYTPPRPHHYDRHDGHFGGHRDWRPHRNEPSRWQSGDSDHQWRRGDEHPTRSWGGDHRSRGDGMGADRPRFRSAPGFGEHHGRDHDDRR